MNKFKRFKCLHSVEEPLCLHNIWDAASAMLVQKTGATALATSSASLAWSLGYADGLQLPVDEMLSAIKRILTVVEVPLSVDIEDGFSNNPVEVASLVKSLANMGVVGINIEDGVGLSKLLHDKIVAIRDSVGEEFFINARTDIYLRAIATGEHAFDMTIERLFTYKIAGANGGFIPGVSSAELVNKLSSSIALPVNVMVENLNDDAEALRHCGVARFSVGPNSFLNAYSRIIGSREDLSYTVMNGLFV